MTLTVDIRSKMRRVKDESRCCTTMGTVKHVEPNHVHEAFLAAEAINFASDKDVTALAKKWKVNAG